MKSTVKQTAPIRFVVPPKMESIEENLEALRLLSRAKYRAIGEVLTGR